MTPFATIEDVINLWRALTPEEIERTEHLLVVISDSLRVEAQDVGKDIDALAKNEAYASVLKSVVVDVVARTLMTSTNQEPMIQGAESAFGYSVSGTYLVPGGGIFIKKSELARLGLRSQRYGALELYDADGGAK